VFGQLYEVNLTLFCLPFVPLFYGYEAVFLEGEVFGALLRFVVRGVMWVFGAQSC